MRIGSKTSIRIGPTLVDRSDGMTPDAKTRVFDSVAHDAERAIDHTSHRVVPHCGSEKEAAVLLVAVEPIPVVVVRVSGGGMRYWVSRWMNRIVIEWGQHINPPQISENDYLLNI